MESNRPGDVLAGRYRLADLLSEAREGRFWYAHDQVLGRPVAIHVIRADDDRAPRLLEAARVSAAIADTRLLRVLDADQRDGQVFVVNEWGAGTSIDHLIATEGPLSPRHAAWITAEVAETIAACHAAGHGHGRLNPENVLLDRSGGIRVIGFGVDAVLHGPHREPADARRIDLDDLGGLLHMLLTGRWAGASESAVPRVPVDHGRVLRPRQVRAGVPRVLDDLCDRALSGDPLEAAPLAAALREYVGDDADVAAALLAGPVPVTPQIELDPIPDPPAPDDTVQVVRDPGPPTEAGLPVFDDEDEQDEPWYAPRADAPAPPPELEEPPERPLFADEPRMPRYDAPPPPPEPEDHWPFHTSAPAVDIAEEPRRVPGRNWLRLALGIALGLALVIAGAFAFHDWHDSGSPAPAPSDSPGTTASTPAPTPITGITATDFDPLGAPPYSEYPELVHYVLDDDPSTSWHTSTYDDQIGDAPRALKAGVGLILDLHGTYTVGTVRLDVGGLAGTTASIYVTEKSPTAAPQGRPAATASGPGTLTITPARPATGRYVLVWLTRLPAVPGGGYRGEVAEVDVTGVPAH